MSVVGCVSELETFEEDVNEVNQFGTLFDKLHIKFIELHEKIKKRHEIQLQSSNDKKKKV